MAKVLWGALAPLNVTRCSRVVGRSVSHLATSKHDGMRFPFSKVSTSFFSICKNLK